VISNVARFGEIPAADIFFANCVIACPLLRHLYSESVEARDSGKGTRGARVT
jgi:hypothetical protein